MNQTPQTPQSPRELPLPEPRRQDQGFHNPLWVEAAAAGYSGAQTDLGRAYLTGSPLPRDTKRSLQWLEAEVDQRSASAMTMLGYAYWKGDGVPRDTVKAEDLLSRAATLGHPSAKRFMASRD